MNIKRAWAEGDTLQFYTEMGWIDWPYTDWIMLLESVSWRVAEEEPRRFVPDNWSEIKRAWAEDKKIQYRHTLKQEWQDWNDKNRLNFAAATYWREKPAINYVKTIRCGHLFSLLVAESLEEAPCLPPGYTEVTEWIKV